VPFFLEGIDILMKAKDEYQTVFTEKDFSMKPKSLNFNLKDTFHLFVCGKSIFSLIQ
jgi:hypothetical protein